MELRELDPFLRAFWHRPADYLPCGNSPFAVSLFPLPWMIPDRSGPIRRRAVYEGKGGLGFRGRVRAEREPFGHTSRLEP